MVRRSSGSTFSPAARATQGWTRAETQAQVLTPLEESHLIGTQADPDSIMCYQIPGSLTNDGDPITGGADIDELDYEFSVKLYPIIES
jgi:hypothetical protein